MEVAAGLPEGAEGDRRQIGASPSGRGVPDPELAEKAKRRRFTAAYKLRIVREADRCERPGEVGALLRREGLYSSLLTQWRRARDSGALQALEPRKRGPAGPSPEQIANAALRRERDQAVSDLQTARRVIEVQGNVSALLEELLAKSAPEKDEQQGTR
jgi:transposase-like protein